MLLLSNRFDYRWFENTLNYFRYRQRLDLNFPSVTHLRLKFFTSEELFIKMNEENLHITRLYAGLNAFDNDYFRLKVHYIFDKKYVWYSLKENGYPRIEYEYITVNQILNFYY